MHFWNENLNPIHLHFIQMRPHVCPAVISLKHIIHSHITRVHVERFNERRDIHN